MVEIPVVENTESLDTFAEQLIFDLEALDCLSANEKKEYIQTYIIPKMDERRNREAPMSSEEVYEKLYRIPNSDKPGEWAELSNEITKYSNTGIEGIANKALEFADIAYYDLQMNSKENLDSIFMYLFMDGTDLPCLFCIAKYSTRLEFGESSRYKKIEKYVMTKYLEYMRDNHPERWWLFFDLKGNPL